MSNPKALLASFINKVKSGTQATKDDVNNVLQYNSIIHKQAIDALKNNNPSAIKSTYNQLKPVIGDGKSVASMAEQRLKQSLLHIKQLAPDKYNQAKQQVSVIWKIVAVAGMLFMATTLALSPITTIIAVTIIFLFAGLSPIQQFKNFIKWAWHILSGKIKDVHDPDARPAITAAFILAMNALVGVAGRKILRSNMPENVQTVLYNIIIALAIILSVALFQCIGHVLTGQAMAPETNDKQP